MQAQTHHFFSGSFYMTESTPEICFRGGVCIFRHIYVLFVVITRRKHASISFGTVHLPFTVGIKFYLKEEEAFLQLTRLLWLWNLSLQILRWRLSLHAAGVFGHAGMTRSFAQLHHIWGVGNTMSKKDSGRHK